MRDGKALKADLGHTPSSPLLTRRSNRLQLDVFDVDLVALKAGANPAGGTLNDGFLAAIAVGLRRWHADHGLALPSRCAPRWRSTAAPWVMPTCSGTT